jgi:hypothetical protein
LYLDKSRFRIKVIIWVRVRFIVSVNPWSVVRVEFRVSFSIIITVNVKSVAKFRV